MRTAFKEWAIVIDALGRGEQIVVLRKGGISEGKGGFQVDHPAFLLFPTLYHQQHESVIPTARERYEQVAPSWPGPDTLRLTWHAQIVAWHRIGNADAALRLKGQHIWKPEVIADRFHWGRDNNIFAMALRVYRLPQRIDLPMRPEYGGCKSWIDLNQDIETNTNDPVLDDAAFATKLKAFHAAVSQGSEPVHPR